MNLLGHSADRRRERRWHLIVPALAGAIGFAATASFADNTAMSMLFLSLAAAGVLTCAPLFWSLPTAFLSARPPPPASPSSTPWATSRVSSAHTWSAT